MVLIHTQKRIIFSEKNLQIAQEWRFFMRDMKKEILDKLAEIEEKENVKVLHAV